jgi:hypothetical protein
MMATAAEVYDQRRITTVVLKWLSKHSKTSDYVGRRIETKLKYGGTVVTPIAKHGHVALTTPKLLENVFNDWTHLAANLSRNTSEDSENSGKAAFKKLFELRKKDLEDSFDDALDTYLTGDGTVADAPQGIRYFVRDDPTVNIEISGLNQVTYPYWQNKYKASSGGAVLNLKNDLRDLHMDITGPQKTHKPNLLLLNADTYKVLEDAVEEFLIITNKAINDPFYGSFIYRGMDVAWTDRLATGIRAYMLGSEDFEWVVDKNLNMYMTEWKQQANVPLDRHAQVVIKGQLLCNNRNRQGVLR